MAALGFGASAEEALHRMKEQDISWEGLKDSLSYEEYLLATWIRSLDRDKYIEFTRMYAYDEISEDFLDRIMYWYNLPETWNDSPNLNTAVEISLVSALWEAAQFEIDKIVNSAEFTSKLAGSLVRIFLDTATALIEIPFKSLVDSFFYANNPGEEFENRGGWAAVWEMSWKSLALSVIGELRDYGEDGFKILKEYFNGELELKNNMIDMLRDRSFLEFLAENVFKDNPAETFKLMKDGILNGELDYKNPIIQVIFDIDPNNPAHIQGWELMRMDMENNKFNYENVSKNTISYYADKAISMNNLVENVIFHIGVEDYKNIEELLQKDISNGKIEFCAESAESIFSEYVYKYMSELARKNPDIPYSLPPEILYANVPNPKPGSIDEMFVRNAKYYNNSNVNTSSNRTYGTYQGSIKDLYDYVDPITGEKYKPGSPKYQEAIKSGKKLEKKPSEQYEIYQDLLQENYGFSASDADKILAMMDTDKGICPYAQLCDINAARGEKNPDQYAIDTGGISFWETRDGYRDSALIDVFVTLNETRNGGTLIEVQSDGTRKINSDGDIRLMGGKGNSHTLTTEAANTYYENNGSDTRITNATQLTINTGKIPYQVIGSYFGNNNQVAVGVTGTAENPIMVYNTTTGKVETIIGSHTMLATDYTEFGLIVNKHGQRGFIDYGQLEGQRINVFEYTDIPYFDPGSEDTLQP